MVCIFEKFVLVFDKEVFKNFGCNFKMVVFGQDKVIEMFNDVILLLCFGFGVEVKLIGSFLFVGLIGVGKIEVI